MRRRRSREIALQVLFSLEEKGSLTKDDAIITSAIKSYLQNFSQKNYEVVVDIDYLQRLTRSICLETKAIDGLIENYSEHWKLYRMTRIDRNILRIGAIELKEFTDIPPKVTIDECVELAKKFGSEESSAFVNGILDRIRSATNRS